MSPASLAFQFRQVPRSTSNSAEGRTGPSDDPISQFNATLAPRMISAPAAAESMTARARGRRFEARRGLSVGLPIDHIMPRSECRRSHEFEHVHRGTARAHTYQLGQLAPPGHPSRVQFRRENDLEDWKRNDGGRS